MSNKQPLPVDQIGRRVDLDIWPPRRIVSLVPSQTEVLFDLGLEEEVVGITKFCVHPERWWREKIRVGGTKKIHFDRIEELNPDLIIANKEENTEAMVEGLSERYPVWVSDVRDLHSALDMIIGLGKLTDREERAQALRSAIFRAWSSLPDFGGIKVAYFIWKNPMMAVGKHTFIDHTLGQLGMENAFGHLSRYPEVSGEDLTRASPELILLSSEPFPFGEKHIADFKRLCPKAVIKLVDGEAFSWYGSRLLKSPATFDKLAQDLSTHS